MHDSFASSETKNSGSFVQHQTHGGILWLTGLSGAGKTSVANGTAAQLRERGFTVVTLDGDVIRKSLNADLGYTRSGRKENIRRVGIVATQLAHEGVIAIASLISPYESDRNEVSAGAAAFYHEIYLSASLAVCEARDEKHLYARARNGELALFTGISDVYEQPKHPDLVLDTEKESLSMSITRLTEYALQQFSLL